MLTSKQRAFLRGLASAEDTIIHVGKGGLTENVKQQADEALTARELIKGKVLESCELSAREVCDALCAACRAEPVQVIGGKFSIYRRNHKEPKIAIPSERSK